MSGKYRKGMTTIIRYYNIKVTYANGKTFEGIRESDIHNPALMERIYKHKAELHFKDTHLTEIIITELSSQSLLVKMYLRKNRI